jgi:hypothetical protein
MGAAMGLWFVALMLIQIDMVALFGTVRRSRSIR